MFIDNEIISYKIIRLGYGEYCHEKKLIAQSHLIGCRLNCDGPLIITRSRMHKTVVNGKILSERPEGMRPIIESTVIDYGEINSDVYFEDTFQVTPENDTKIWQKGNQEIFS